MLLLYLFIAVVLVNTAYFILFSKFSMSIPSQIDTKENFPVSVIICAKNEAENLKKNILNHSMILGRKLKDQK